MPGNLTMKRIAEMAGTSVSTVSRTLSNPANARISSATRERILKVVQETGFVRNHAASHLAASRRADSEGAFPALGADANAFSAELIFQNLHRPEDRDYGGFTDALFAAISGALPEASRVVASSYGAQPPTAQEILNLLLARRADSLVAYRPTQELGRELAAIERRIPITTLFYPIPGGCIDTIAGNPGPALKTMLRRRIAAGRRVFFFAMHLSWSQMHPAAPYALIERAFLEVMSEAAIAPLLHVCAREMPRAAATAEFSRRAEALPDGAVIVCPNFHTNALSRRERFDVIRYTEYQPTLQSEREAGVSVLYMDLDKVAAAAVAALKERRQKGPNAAARTVTVEPDVFDAGSA